MMIGPQEQVNSWPSEEEALRLAGEGNLEAQLYLGWAYDRHGSLEYNAGRALLWLRRAVEAGSIEAKRRLCRFLYDQGQAETAKLASELVDNGDFFGNYIMGHLLAHGDCGVVKDVPSALQHFDKAAEQGHLISKIDRLRFGSRWGWYNPFALIPAIGYGVQVALLSFRNPRDPAVFR